MVTKKQTLHEKLLQVMDASRLWEGGQRHSHGFLLSPDVYAVSAEHQRQLDELAPALNECLSGLGRLVTIAQTPDVARTDAYKLIHGVANMSTPHYYSHAQMRRPSSLPIVCKCDLLDATDGTLKIAEIDGMNKHGFGYGVLVNRLRDAIVGRWPENSYPSIARVVADEVKRRFEKTAGQHVSPVRPHLGILVGEHERFYLPEFAIFAEQLDWLGIDCTLLREFDLRVNDELLADIPSLLLDLPDCRRNRGLSQALAQFYLEGLVDFLLPPKPFLGSKGLLALLRNDEKSEELECVLRSQIPRAALERVRAHIPPTYLVLARNLEFIRNELLGSGTPYVLKAVISNGMKGTIFMDDERFETVMDELRYQSGGDYILQEEVPNKTDEFRYFHTNGEVRDDTWYKRVIVHFAAGRDLVRGYVADIDITARRDKKVHGANDCLQLGVVRAPIV
jgi:hypothetical protein